MNRGESLAYRKADLHVHTPKSACFADKSVTPEQIVEVALANALEVIAITNHNTIATIDEIRQVARKKKLFVFPGIELSTKGGHVIALFELDTPVARLEDFLDYIGVDREGRGDAITLADGSMEEVCKKIEEQGGVAIAAHIERWPSGFLETNEPRRVKMRIHDCEHLSALEITVPQSKGLWNAGKMHGFPKEYACIQGSDAHALSEIGRRPVYIEMENVGLTALRTAFFDYKVKIVFPNECTPSR